MGSSVTRDVWTKVVIAAHIGAADSTKITITAEEEYMDF